MPQWIERPQVGEGREGEGEVPIVELAGGDEHAPPGGQQSGAQDAEGSKAFHHATSWGAMRSQHAVFGARTPGPAPAAAAAGSSGLAPRCTRHGAEGAKDHAPLHRIGDGGRGVKGQPPLHETGGGTAGHGGIQAYSCVRTGGPGIVRPVLDTRVACPQRGGRSCGWQSGLLAVVGLAAKL